MWQLQVEHLTPQCDVWLHRDGERLRGQGRAGVGSQWAAGQEGAVLVKALEKLSRHLRTLCMAQAAVARIWHTQAELYQNWLTETA